MTSHTRAEIVISTDAHCGADVLAYKPYLESKYQDDFDAWARVYEDPWCHLDDQHSVEFRQGLASFQSSLNWDSDRRRRINDIEGVAAEVLLPNTAPPFFPSNMISAPGPSNANEFEYRWAGLRAHNRWLVDFCNDLPDRRAGFAQIFLDDLDEAVREVRWAAEAGLKGILLPGDHVLKLVNLYYPAYDRLWATCEEVGLPIHRHAILPTESEVDGGIAAPWIGSVESPFYGLRAIAHLICAGVFERFPNLKFVAVELANAVEIPAMLKRLDGMYLGTKTGTSAQLGIDAAVAGLPRLPSEYFTTNCFLGGPHNHRDAYEAGVPNLMFGTDLPHNEGTAPYTHAALRRIFSGLPSEEIREMASLRAASVYGFELDKLQAVADQIGLSLEEIRMPLPKEEWPEYPAQTRCSVFSDGLDPQWTTRGAMGDV
jgi:predicted TIM-barrel fold metal-dependent hydrolase